MLKDYWRKSAIYPVEARVALGLSKRQYCMVCAEGKLCASIAVENSVECTQFKVHNLCDLLFYAVSIEISLRPIDESLCSAASATAKLCDARFPMTPAARRKLVAETFNELEISFAAGRVIFVIEKIAEIWLTKIDDPTRTSYSKYPLQV